jgi:hypothetical protein
MVLAACLDDAVVLGADSWIFRESSPGNVVYAGVDRKLFKLERGGIATFGGDPNYAGHVPSEIDRHIPKNLNPEETCKSLHHHFAAAKGMCALVAGFDVNGIAVLYELRIPNGYALIARSSDSPSQLFYRGFIGGELDYTMPRERISVIDQILGWLRSHSGQWAGPPYDFLVVERG